MERGDDETRKEWESPGREGRHGAVVRADTRTASSCHSRMFPVGLSCRVFFMTQEGGLEAAKGEAIVERLECFDTCGKETGVL
jgi:hypothetical protein